MLWGMVFGAHGYTGSTLGEWIFPVGILVSLVSAALLRNSRFLPARPSPTGGA